MTAEQIIDEIRQLPETEAKKVARFMDEEWQDAFDAKEAKRLSCEFKESGEQGIPAAEVFRSIRD